MKRFYRSAATTPADAGHAILLDGRPIKTPGRATLIVPTPALAESIASEWRAQGEDILPASMALTGLANAAIDLVAPDVGAFAAPLVAYGESDLLCYRSPDRELAADEAAAWNPILAWAEARYGIEFALAAGVMHVPQPAETVRALGQALRGQSPFTLAALSPIVTLGGSLVIALALAEQAFDASTLWGAAVLDELWQEARWGADADAVAARAHRQREWVAAARFLELLR